MQQWLTSMQHAQYMLLFLELMVNSDHFQISWSYIHTLTLATRSHVLLTAAILTLLLFL